MAGMLSREEKAYCRGLEALRKKDYAAADQEFKECESAYCESRGYRIIAQAAALLADLRREKEAWEKVEPQLEEIANHGQETVLRREGFEESTR